MPRLPTRVADLATRYESPEPPPSPTRLKRASHLIRRQNNIVQVAQIDTSPHFQSTDASQQDAIPFESDGHDPAETRGLEKERQLLQLERELELKAREIERGREELIKARRDIAKQPPSPSTPPQLAQQLIPRSRDRNRQQQLEVPFPASQTDTAESPSSASRHSYNSAHSSSQLEQAPLTPSPTSSVQQANHLLHSPQPLPSISQHVQRTSPSPQSASQTYARSPHVDYRTSGPPADMLPRPATQSVQSKGQQQHPPYCGCERCTAKYREAPNPTPSSHALRPPDQPITLRPSSSGSGEGSWVGNGEMGGKRSVGGEKPKVGWMRRLSMPIVMGHALNLDSSSFKKGHREGGSGSGLYTLGAGIGNTPLPSPQSRGGLFSLDGKRNASATNLRSAHGGVSVREDGKLAGRRSYETNLAAGRSARR